MTIGRAYDGAFVDEATVVEAVKAGAVAFNHYLTGQHASTSCSPALAHKHGLGSIATYERAPGELVGLSRKGGQAVGQVIAAAMTSAGYPHGTAFYASVDVRLAAGDSGACDQALLGIRDVIDGRWQTRVYGQGSLLQHVYGAHLVDGPGWLSGSKSYPGWQIASVAPYTCMVQQVGSDIPSTDRNTVTSIEALDAWWPDDSPYGDNMTPAQFVALLKDPEVRAELEAVIWTLPKFKNYATPTSTATPIEFLQAINNIVEPKPGTS